MDTPKSMSRPELDARPVLMLSGDYHRMVKRWCFWGSQTHTKMPWSRNDSEDGILSTSDALEFRNLLHTVPPAYGDFLLALVMHSNERGPGPRHNMKEDPGSSTLIMKREHGQEVPCDPGQVKRILGCTSPPLPLPPIRATRAEPPPAPFWYLLHPLPTCWLRLASEENTLQPLVRGQRPWIGQEEDVEAILIFSALL